MTPMRLQVRHETHYDYDTPLAYSAQRLHLTPLDFASQKVVSWAIATPGIEAALTYLDGFGNRVHLVTCENQTGPVSIVASGIVEVSDTAGVVQGADLCSPRRGLPAPDAGHPAQHGHRFARQPRGRPVPRTTLELLHALMGEIHARVAYEIGSTHAHTTAAEAFAEGRGVCQDHAHIFIGAARNLGLPSRYVTGYLVTGDGASSTAAHAWAETLVPNLGWVGFDPANCKCPTDHYVRVAGGIDAGGVTPIRGTQARRGYRTDEG